MKKILYFCMVMATAMLLVGCDGKFEPTESTIFVTSKGKVKSALMESFEEPYYDFEELSENIEREVKSYCLDVNREEAVVVESLVEENDQVTLLMNYESAEDYMNFNEVLFLYGTYESAVDAGYAAAELYDLEGNHVELDAEEMSELMVVVTEESVCIQTPKKIRYISDNVSIIDKKLGKAFEAGKSHPAFVLYK